MLKFRLAWFLHDVGREFFPTLQECARLELRMMREQRFGNEPIIVGIISAGIRDYVGIHSAREYIERRNKVDAELRVPIQQRTVRPLRWQGPSRPLGLLSGIHSLPLARPSVFIVHGHDDALTNDVARTLEKLGLDPIILHEKADQGQTIIEKLELHADVQYAVVLITPDDDHVDNKTKTSVKRARQNVILELGFFLAHLGRERVFILRKDDPHLELPSDYQGVI